MPLRGSCRAGVSSSLRRSASTPGTLSESPGRLLPRHRFELSSAAGRGQSCPRPYRRSLPTSSSCHPTIGRWRRFSQAIELCHRGSSEVPCAWHERAPRCFGTTARSRSSGCLLGRLRGSGRFRKVRSGGSTCGGGTIETVVPLTQGIGFSCLLREYRPPAWARAGGLQFSTVRPALRWYPHPRGRFKAI